MCSFWTVVQTCALPIYGAGCPIGWPDAVALHVSLEPGSDRVTRGAVRPLRLEGLRGERPDPGHVADQRPDLLRRCLDLHGHLTAERLDDLHRVLLQLVLPSSRAVADGLIRSEERRVGTECVSPCRSWWSLYH